MRQEAMKDRTARVTARVGDLLQEGDVLYFEQQSCSYVTSDGGVRVDFASVHAPGGSFAVDDPVEPARE